MMVINRKVALRECLVPQYEGMEVLSELVDELVQIYGDNVDAILLNTSKVHNNATSSTQGKINLKWVDLHLLLDEAGLGKRTYDQDVIVVKRYGVQGVEIRLLNRKLTNNYLEHIGKVITSTTPAVVLYASERFKKGLS